MTYEEYKTYLTEFLWKRGDTVVIEALDPIIKMAEAELDRSLKVASREVLASITATSDLAPLPDDFRQLRSLYSLDGPYTGAMKYIAPSVFVDRKVAYKGAALSPYYTISGNNLRLIGKFSEDRPVELLAQYYKAVPSFRDNDQSWLADEFLDVFTYTTLKHTAPFLREDERLPVWASLFTAAMASAMDEQADRQYAGSPLQIQFPTGIR